MKRLNLTGFTFAIGMILANSTLAGFKYNAPVVIDDATTKSFWGSFAGARNSANGIEFISCIDIRSVGQCTARDANYVSKSCITRDPVHLALIRSLSDASWLRVGYGTNGTCTSITRSMSSIYGPMR